MSGEVVIPDVHSGRSIDDLVTTDESLDLLAEIRTNWRVTVPTAPVRPCQAPGGGSVTVMPNAGTVSGTLPVAVSGGSGAG
jgi:hypothetical protein